MHTHTHAHTCTHTYIHTCTHIHMHTHHHHHHYIIIIIDCRLFLMASFILPVLPACIPLYNLNSSYGSSGLWWWVPSMGHQCHTMCLVLWHSWLQCNEQSSMNSALNLGLYMYVTHSSPLCLQCPPFGSLPIVRFYCAKPHPLVIASPLSTRTAVGTFLCIPS